MLRTVFLAACAALSVPVAALAEADLMDIYLRALQEDPRVKIAEQKLVVGEARNDASFGQLLPQVSLHANYSDNDVEFPDDDLRRQEYDGQRYSLQVRQMLFNWSRLAARSHSERVVRQYRAELLDVLSVMLVDVAERYFNVLLADDDLKLIRAERELVEQQVRQTDEMYRRKLVRVTDFYETRARADSVRTDEIEAENRAALARESLVELTGGPVAAVAPLRPEFELPGLDNPVEHWTGLALADNRALQARREAVEAAAQAVRQQKGGRYPTVDLVLSAQDSDIGYDNQPANRRQTQYVGIDIVVPVYSGGAASAAIREARAQYYIAREEQETTRREVVRRTRESWLNTRSSRQRIESAQLNVASAGKSYEAMSRSFSYGAVTATDVLVALHAQTQARRNYQNARYGFIVNWLALKHQSGRLTQDDLRQVNDWLLAAADP